MRKITTILLLAFLAFSCTTDNPDEGVVNVDLQGDWVLDDVSCFCFFGPETDFSQYRISFQGSRLIVSGEGETMFLAANGTYTYTVEGNLITLPSGVQYRYQIIDQQLQLIFVDNPQLADDEITLFYYKN